MEEGWRLDAHNTDYALGQTSSLLHRSKLTIAERIHVRARKMAQELSLAFSMDHFHGPSTHVDCP